MKRFRAPITGVVAALLLALSFGCVASAATAIKQTGQIGDHGTRPAEQGPEANCVYTGFDNSGLAHLRAIKVYPVLAGPAGGRTTQKVSWTVKIQSSPTGAAPWTYVATSATQIATATDTTSAQFATIKVRFAGKGALRYRAVSTLKWLHAG